MSASKQNPVYIGSKGTVLALKRVNGAVIWQTPLKGSAFVNLAFDDGDLIATTKGEVFCLDPATGRIRWNNPMRGFGYGLISIAGSGASSGTSSTVAMAEELDRQQEAAAAAPPVAN